MSELYHKGGGNPWHDFLGRFTFRPGGRRSAYVDKDGNLTDSGIEQYKTIVNRDREAAKDYFDKKFIEGEKARAGVISKNGEEYVKKGSTFTRYADSSEKLDHKRKYVSVTKEDESSYHEVALEGALGIQDINKIKEFKYTAVKDIKVASGRAVVEHLLDKYGDMKVSEVFKRTEANEDDMKVVRTALENVFGGEDVRSIQKDTNRFDLVYDLDLNKYKGDDRKVLEAAMQYASTRDRAMSGFYNQKLMTEPTENNPTFDHFVKLGYDAIVDVEDAEWANYPLILLDPASSVRMKKG